MLLSCGATTARAAEMWLHDVCRGVSIAARFRSLHFCVASHADPFSAAVVVLCVMAQSKAAGKTTAAVAKGKGSSAKVPEALMDDPLGDESLWLSPVLKFSALGLICLMSFSIRIFSVRLRCTPPNCCALRDLARDVCSPVFAVTALYVSCCVWLCVRCCAGSR